MRFPKKTTRDINVKIFKYKLDEILYPKDIHRVKIEVLLRTHTGAKKRPHFVETKLLASSLRSESHTIQIHYNATYFRTGMYYIDTITSIKQ